MADLREDIQTSLFAEQEEKIVYCLKVFDDKKLQPPSSALPPLASKLRQKTPNNDGSTHNLASAGNKFDISRKTSNGPEPSAVAGAGNPYGSKDKDKRVRYLCLTIKKQKIRLHKVKQESSGFQISKTWSLDEVKVIDNVDPFQFVLMLNKQYIFQCEEPKEKIQFLFILVRLCLKHLKRQPKFVNASEEGLEAELRTYENREKLIAASDEDDDHGANDAIGGRRGLSPLEEAFLKIQYEQEELNVYDVLVGYDWNAGKDASALEERLLNELTALEAANIHAIIQADEQSVHVVNLIQETIDELDKVNEWLTLYSVELQSMGRDIGNIESQNKGLQIQTTNQKSLQRELKDLMAVLAFPEDLVYTLQHEDLSDIDGIKRLEKACGDIKVALTRKVDDSLQQMTAVTERMSMFGQYVASFSSRLIEFLKTKINQESEKLLSQEFTTGTSLSSLHLPIYENLEDELLPYRNLIGWVKEMDSRKHSELQMHFVLTLNKCYKKDIKNFLDVIRANPHKRSDDELDYLLVQYSKSSFFSNSSLAPGVSGGIKSVSMASMLGHRKALSADSRAGLGVSPSDDGGKKKKFNDSASQLIDATGDEKITPDEAFKKLLSNLIENSIRMQNFIVDFFHLSGCKPPNTKISLIMADLSKPRDFPKDLKATKKLEELLSTLMDGFSGELYQWMEAAVKIDLSFIMGLMVVLEVERKSSNAQKVPFLVNLFNSIHEKLVLAMDKFVDEQIKTIEETKVNLKGKNIRVVSFIRVFPVFVRRMEGFIKQHPDAGELEARKYMNNVYERMTKLMFDNLEKIAREAENASEDKEQMYAHILSLENMHHLYNELRGQKVSFLDSHVKYAKEKYDADLNAYIRSVVRKPLGKLLDFFEGIEDLLKAKSPEEVGFHFNYNKAALRKVIAAYPGKEIRKSIESLKKRVDKHYSEEEGLLQVVWRGIQEEFIRLHRHFESLIQKCYPDTDAKLGFTVDDLCVYFSDIAKMK